MKRTPVFAIALVLGLSAVSCGQTGSAQLDRAIQEKNIDEIRKLAATAAVDKEWKNPQGKTLLAAAEETKDKEIIKLVTYCALRKDMKDLLGQWKLVDEKTKKDTLSITISENEKDHAFFLKLQSNDPKNKPENEMINYMFKKPSLIRYEQGIILSYVYWRFGNTVFGPDIMKIKNENLAWFCYWTEKKETLKYRMEKIIPQER